MTARGSRASRIPDQRSAKSRAKVTGCVFSSNHADAPGGRGGAIATGGKSKLLVTGSQFTGNSSNEGGGALSIAGSGNISDSVISGNMRVRSCS